jgi:phage replication O-like protein O
MASPQCENGYTRTANELSEAIMQSDFSKRQLNILNLIIRMSYGCGKKSALVKYNDFELVGVYKADIKKELDYLSSVRVISIEYITNLSMIEAALNKNYDQWRVSLVKGFCAEKWEQLLHRNLQNNVSKTLTEVSEIQTPVSEIPTDSKSEVSKILTEQSRTVSKTLTGTPEKMNDDAESQPPKEIDLKEIAAADDDDNQTPLSPQSQSQNNLSPLDELENLVPELFGRFMAKPREIESMKRLLNITDNDTEFIIATVKEAYREYKPQYSGDKIKSFVYFEDRVKQEWSNRQARDKPEARSGTGGASGTIIPIGPDVREILFYYRDLFSRVLKMVPVINENRDGPYIQNMLGTISKDDLKQMISIYLLSDDEFAKKSGYTIPVMNSQLNQLGLELQKQKGDYGGTINWDDYPGGTECKCGGTGILAIWDPEANNGRGTNRAIPCPHLRNPDLKIAATGENVR